MTRYIAKIMVSISCFLVNYCTSQIIEKQVKIPLNNYSGVPYFNGLPYYKGPLKAYGIHDFDVDTSGNYYFIKGDQEKGATTLAIFKGNKQKYRKTYNGFYSNNVFIYKNKILMLTSSGANGEIHSLCEFNIKDGKIIKEYPRILAGFINIYDDYDSLVVLNVLDTARQSDCFKLLKLNEGLIENAENQNSYNLPDSLFIANPKHIEIQYLGQWREFFLFWAWDAITPGAKGVGYYKFFFEDKHCKIIGISTFDEKIFGKMLFAGGDQYRKLRNSKIYILGQDGKNALITELSVEELYKDVIQHPPLSGSSGLN